jgi:hypothetical protein
VQVAQCAYFDELVDNDNTWRVTDFITLGSPLAHAEVLLARDRSLLKARQRDREFPTCLPELETVMRDHEPHQRFSFPLDPRKPDGYRVPHHAAVFGPTRWTNLYFPSCMIVHGDLIGGPLSRVLGAGIRDQAVDTTLRGGFFSHTSYWTMPVSDDEAAQDVPMHIVALREAVNLADRRGTAGPPVETV